MGQWILKGLFLGKLLQAQHLLPTSLWDNPRSAHWISIGIVQNGHDYIIVCILMYVYTFLFWVGVGGLCVGGCRWDASVLVAGPEWGEAYLLGRLPAGSAAVLLQSGGELHGHELLLQLRCRQRHMVPLTRNSTDKRKVLLLFFFCYTDKSFTRWSLLLHAWFVTCVVH